MRDTTDYEDSESLIDEARLAYSEIYYWHTTHGKRRFDERFRERQESEAWKTKYVALLSELIKPAKATVQDMLHAAREVLSGRMEWAYGETSEQGVALSDCARRIEGLLRGHKKRLARDRATEQLRNFKNFKSGTVSNGQRVEIPLQDNEAWSRESYIAYANVAYHDVPQTDDVGGRIFLIQTNLERTRNDRTGYVFHNAKLLHVETIDEERSLPELIRRGDLLVESLVLGE